MESIEQPFDSLAHIASDFTDTNDKTGLIETNTRTKQFANGDSPRAESSPLHQGKSTNSLLHGPQNKGLRIIIISSIVFAVAVTVALILTIYLEPKQVHGHAAVATEDARCSEVGLQVLQDGGNAVDAAVAAAFCLGVVNPAHSGIGGGGVALVDDHKFKKAEGYNFMETIPVAGLGRNQQSAFIGVPGFVKGLAMIHSTYGKLLWKDLLQPAIDLAQFGFSVSDELARVFQTTDIEYFKKSKLGHIFLNGNVYKDVNETIVWHELAATLRKIQDSPDSFYSGDLLADFLLDVEADGSIVITDQDMKNYTVQQPEVLKTQFKELTVVGLPPPAGGTLVALMLNMIDKLDWKQNHGSDGLTYHQLIEVFKFAYAQKSLLSDPAFDQNVENVTTHLTSPEFAAELVKKINNNNTFDSESEYGQLFTPSTSVGMSHISVIDSSELMVSMTLSLSSHFGSKILLPRTGIWLNNALQDFNGFSEEVVPGRRSLSSMSPTVLYNNEHPCAHRLIIGASNGEKILTGIVQAVVNSVIFKMNMVDAIKAPRVHDQLVPNETLYESGIPGEVITNLAAKHHIMEPWIISESSCMVTGIEKTNDDILTYSDFRKFGKAAHY
uniref:Gamma-glutamyltransferase n=1 Tax=Arion vulgaris TaxID=1028688 RepID=A0A0B7A1Y2_9EUPU